MFKDLCTDQEVGRLVLANIQGFGCSADSSREMAVLTKPLNKHCAQRGMGLNHENA